MARYERVAQIYALLTEATEPQSLETLCAALGASTATVKRLVRFMREELGMAIDFDRARGGYRVELGAGQLLAGAAGIPVAAEQALGVLAGAELLGQLPPLAFGRELAGNCERAVAGPISAAVRRARPAPRLRLRLTQHRAVDPARLRTILQALLSARRLRIRYASRSRDGDTERVVSPQRLTFYRSNWYLAAWCHSARELRVFSVDRIGHAEATPLPAERIAEALLESRLDSGYGIFAGEANAIAVLHFDASAARWVADEQWHAQQRLDRLADGSVILYVPYRHATELRADILRWGPAVEVKGPATLRADVAAAAAATSARYV